MAEHYCAALQRAISALFHTDKAHTLVLCELAERIANGGLVDDGVELTSGVNSDTAARGSAVIHHLWRGECGHHWIKSEIDECPICKLATVTDAHLADSSKLLDLEIDSASRLLDGLKTIADGELGTIEEAMSYANTLVRLAALSSSEERSNG